MWTIPSIIATIIIMTLDSYSILKSESVFNLSFNNISPVSTYARCPEMKLANVPSVEPVLGVSKFEYV